MSFFKCDVDPVINCVPYGPFIKNVTELKVYEKFKIKIGSNNTDVEYEIVGPSPWETCEGNDICIQLPLDNTSEIPFRVSDDETRTNFEANSFSLIKQQELAEVIFNLSTDSIPGDKRINVFFP